MGGTAYRVLLAEDDGAMRGLLAGMLRRDGLTVEEAANGAELLRRASDSGMPTPDLIISDVHMPHLSGLEAVRRLRASGLLAPVLLITSFGEPEMIRDAHAIGCALLEKPFAMRDFRSAVRAHLRPIE